MLKYFLLFVPLAFILEYMGASPTYIFIVCSLAIVPLAGWLGHATEELAGHFGAAVGGLLNATFGNATELIIAFFALLAGQVEVVKASLIGSIIGNVLLVLGLAALMGGWRRIRLTYNVDNIKTLASMLEISMIGFIVPAVFDFNERVIVADSPTHALTLDADLSLGVAIVLFILYVGNIVFSLITHKDLLSSSDEMEAEQGHANGAGWSIQRSLGVLFLATVLIAFLSEFLVGALEGFTETIGLSAGFVGLVVIPIVGNAAEHSSAVTFAMKNKMDLAVSIAVGSALQIALLVAPLLVFASWLIGQPMDLVLRGPLELVALIGSVLIANSVARDGETNWYEGLMLLGVYLILGIAFFFTPSVL